MVTRLIGADASEILQMSAEELKGSIAASAGRTVLSENIVIHTPVYPGVTNAEIARAFGADLILLNMVDLDNPQIHGLSSPTSIVEELHRLVGAPIGVNLEPVDDGAAMLENKTMISPGRQASPTTLAQLEDFGADFV